MFTQFFENYLVNKGIITNEQLKKALSKKNDIKVKLGTLAIEKGYMTFEEIEKIHELQKTSDEKMGVLAIKNGYLTNEQVDELLSKQGSDYMLLMQALLDTNTINKEQFQNIVNQYKEKFESIEKIEDKIERLAKLLELFSDLYDFSDLTEELISQYFILLINDVIRFIGDDFVFEGITREKVSKLDVTFSQSTESKFEINTMFNMSQGVAIEFASRFAKEHFEVLNQEVEEILCNFLNTHNKIFINKLLNQYGIEINLNKAFKLDNIEEKEGTIIKLGYTFGRVEFIVFKL